MTERGRKHKEAVVVVVVYNLQVCFCFKLEHARCLFFSLK